MTDPFYREGHIEIELPAVCLGIDDIAGDLDLVAEDARAPAPIDVTLRSRAGLCVLARLGVRIAARSVRVEGIAVAGALVQIEPRSLDPPPLRLTEGTAVTAPLGELPPYLAPDPTVVEVAGETVDALVRADVAAAPERVLAVDGRLARVLDA